MFYILALIAFYSFPALCGVNHDVAIGQKVFVASGDTVRLKGKNYSVIVGQAPESVPCAVPGRNCGSGYVPAHPIFTVKCPQSPCPYFLNSNDQSSTTAEVVIHTEESCSALKHMADSCFYSFARTLKSVDECTVLKGALGRYFCIMRFQNTVPSGFRSICDQLPQDIYGLRGNCYYEWAIRLKDSSFCDKYEPGDFSGSERCWLKMVEILKDKSLCRHVKKEPLYVEQCQGIKF